MGILRYAGPFAVEQHAVCGLKVREVHHVGNVEHLKIPTHEVALVGNDRWSTDEWCGERFPNRHWKAGSVSFLPQNTVLSSLLKPGDYNETIIMLDERIFVRAAADHIDYSRIEFRYEDITSPVTTHLATTIREFTVADDTTQWPLMVESASIALVVAIIRSLSPDASTVFSSLKSGLSVDRKRRVLEYIEDNLQRHVSIDEMAHIAALSPYHFVRSFRASVGQTPLKYVARRRIEEANKLLRGSNMPLAEVAAAAGYSSQSHMNTVFKKLLGVTPGKIRKGLLGLSAVALVDWSELLLTIAEMA